MANPLQHAQKSFETTESQVKGYVGSVFPRLSFNYGLLIGMALIVSMFVVPALRLWISPSTASIIGFSGNLLLFVYGWRWLEQRNKATTLYLLYTRYSRQRRDLDALIKQAEAQTLSNLDTLYTQVDTFEEAAKSFLTAAQAAGLEAKSDKA